MKLKNLPLYYLIFYVQLFFAQLTPQQMAAKMGRGINLGNTLDAPTEGAWRTSVDIATYFKDIKAAGFKHVRIPVRWDSYVTPNYLSNKTNVSDYTVATTYLDRVSAVVDAALAEGLVVVMNAHHEHWFTGTFNASDATYYLDPSTSQSLIDARKARFKAIWAKISSHFKSKSDNLLFEIINEPYFDMNKAQVDDINKLCLPIIRANNPTRKVILTGGGENNQLAPQQIDPTIFSDQYLMVTFHYYEPFSFTASSREEYTDNEWGTAADKENIDKDFDAIKTWAAAYNIPIFLGEYGADNVGGYNYENGIYGLYGGPTEESRNSFHRYIANAAIARGIIPCVWDAGPKSNKTLYLETSRTWVDSTLRAVLGTDYLLDKPKEFNFLTNGNTENWSATAANISVSSGILSFTPTAATPELKHSSLGLDTTVHHKIEVVLKNNTTNGYLSVSFPDGQGGRTYVGKVISTKDSAYKTYQFDLLGKLGWSGQQNEIIFHLKYSATTNAVVKNGASLLIDKIKFFDGTTPINYKSNFTFDTTSDYWTGQNSIVTLGTGVINVACVNNTLAGVKLSGATIDAYPNYWMHITLKNNSVSNNRLKVQLLDGSGVVEISTADTSYKTYHINLGQMPSWKMDVNQIQVLFYDALTGLSSNSGNIVIDKILFDGVAPAVTYSGKFDFNVDGQSEGWVFSGTQTELISNGILTIASNSVNPKMEHAGAGVDTAKKYMVFYLKNNSMDNLFKISYPNGSGGRTYRNLTLTTKDNSYKKYIIDVSGIGWTGIVNDIQILLSSGTSTQTGNIEIDSIVFEQDPYGAKNDYAFTGDNFGWRAGTSEATTNAITSGMEVVFDKSNQYPKVSSYNYSFEVTNKKWAYIKLTNNSTCNKLHLKLPDGTLTAKQTMVAGDQVLNFDLSSYAIWDGAISPNTFSFCFTETGLIPTGSMLIKEIKFTNTSIAGAVNNRELQLLEEVAEDISTGVFVNEGVLQAKYVGVQKVFLYGVNGNLVKQTSANYLDITEMAKGIYYVLIQLADGRVISEKVIL